MRVLFYRFSSFCAEKIRTLFYFNLMIFVMWTSKYISKIWKLVWMRPFFQFFLGVRNLFFSSSSSSSSSAVLAVAGFRSFVSISIICLSNVFVVIEKYSRTFPGAAFSWRSMVRIAFQRFADEDNSSSANGSEMDTKVQEIWWNYWLAKFTRIEWQWMIDKNSGTAKTWCFVTPESLRSPDAYL